MKILFVVTVCCISITVFAQKGDYLIKNNGDTVWGTAILKEKQFYINGSSAVINAEDVMKVKSSNYKGTTVVDCKLQTYVDNLADLEIDYIQRGVVDTVMILEEIYNSPRINLYFGKNDGKTHYYFYKTPTDPKPVQLVIRYFLQGGLANYNNDRARYRGDKSKVTLIEDKGYVNQLRAIMGDCNKISQTTWELLAYRSYSLKQVMKKYNQCN
ncbi:MAG TPA: hypothetical protein VHL77_11985 [Ferruginibacter sp.]|nr:hypothetical protein [Ferruginibacter sp.]